MPPPPAVEATGVAEKSIGRGLGLALGALR